jgi:hypothetical protein
MTVYLATHVSWNLFAPELFGLPSIQVKQALGLVGLAFVMASLVRVARGGMRRPEVPEPLPAER